MSIAWPTTLPPPLLGRTHSVQPRTIVIQMESERSRARSQFTESIEVISAQWNFTLDQFSLFEDFFINDLEQGSLLFELTASDPSSPPGYANLIVWALGFFPATYHFSRSDNLFSVTATLEVDSIEMVEVVIIPPTPTTGWISNASAFAFDTDSAGFGLVSQGVDYILFGKSSSGPWVVFSTAGQGLIMTGVSASAVSSKSNSTWEDMGVPHGSTVVGVRVKSLRWRLRSAYHINSHTFSMGIVGTLFTVTPPTVAGDWVTVGEQPKVTLSAPSSALFVFWMSYTMYYTGITDVSLIFDIDDIVLDIEYQ